MGMRPVTVTVTGLSSSSPVPLNLLTDAYAVGLFTRVTGSMKGKVEITGQQWQTASGQVPTTLIWQTVSGMGNIGTFAKALPVPATMVRVTATGGTGTMALDVVEYGR